MDTKFDTFEQCENFSHDELYKIYGDINVFTNIRINRYGRMDGFVYDRSDGSILARIIDKDGYFVCRVFEYN